MKKKVTVGGGRARFSKIDYMAIIQQYGSGIFGSPIKREIEIDLPDNPKTPTT